MTSGRSRPSACSGLDHIGGIGDRVVRVARGRCRRARAGRRRGPGAPRPATAAAGASMCWFSVMPWMSTTAGWCERPIEFVSELHPRRLGAATGRLGAHPQTPGVTHAPHHAPCSLRRAVAAASLLAACGSSSKRLRLRHHRARPTHAATDDSAAPAPPARRHDARRTRSSPPASGKDEPFCSHDHDFNNATRRSTTRRPPPTTSRSSSPTVVTPGIGEAAGQRAGRGQGRHGHRWPTGYEQLADRFAAQRLGPAPRRRPTPMLSQLG